MTHAARALQAEGLRHWMIRAQRGEGDSVTARSRAVNTRALAVETYRTWNDSWTTGEQHIALIEQAITAAVAAERGESVQLAASMNYLTRITEYGPPNTGEQHIALIEQAIAVAVAFEKEQCARLAMSMIGATRKEIAAAIRARGRGVHDNHLRLAL